MKRMDPLRVLQVLVMAAAAVYFVTRCSDLGWIL